MRFTFRCEEAGEPIEEGRDGVNYGGQVLSTVAFEAETWYAALYQFRNFLLGAGFQVGELGEVDSLEPRRDID